MFKLNLEKAKEVHKEVIRFHRKEALEKLDVQYMRALETGNTEKVAKIASIKQQLRDLPSCDEIQNATCLDDLKNHWPDILECKSPYK